VTTIVQGLPAAPGIAIGPVWLYDPGEAAPGEPAAAGLDPALAIERATAEAARQLEMLADRLRAADRAEEAGIFEAQAMMAEDDSLVSEAVRRARAGAPLVVAVQEAAALAAGELAAVDDELLAARAADVRDVGMRICRILTGTVIELPSMPSVIVGEDIPPSFSAEIPPGLALGFALAGGSRTAHAVILARSLGLPAVVGAAGVCEAASASIKRAQAGTTGAMDGETGEVFLDVDVAVAEELRGRQRRLVERRARAAMLRARPGGTADGRRVLLVANIGTPDEAPRALEAAAEGVGLFRTEFLFLSRASEPTEAEQVAAYRRVLTAFGPDRPVVIRLADIGGDKPIPYLGLPAEANPFLGVRAIRLAYDAPQLIQTQLRAIWRAGGQAGIVPHVMAPMVATVEDVELLHSLRDAARQQVLDAGEPCAEAMVTGIMVEVPSAALLAHELAARVDFMSIGTNDLTQYIFAADRGNAALASMQDALHPAVLRAIAMIVAAGRDAGITVAVCGELAGDPAGACVLVGLGVTELSADAASLDELRATLAGISSADLEELAQGALRAPDARAVRALAASLIASRAQPGEDGATLETGSAAAPAGLPRGS
jgi:phosphoenolpyruvate-protein phosphotransferase